MDDRDQLGLRAAAAPPHRLDPLLSPASIALVGASPRAESAGLAMVEMCRIDGYAGRVHPVNPRYQRIADLACHASLAELPGRVDHVVIGLASAQLEAALEEAITHGARAATIFATAQLDVDTEPRLARRLAHRAREAGIALCGPSSMGFYCRLAGLRVAGFPSPPGLRAGGIVFIAQSGSAFSALAHNDRRLGFVACISSGMELTTSAADYLDWAVAQPQTRVVGLFLEEVREPARFVAALQAAAARGIPVVVLKVGRTARSAAMAVSHTGAMAGSDLAFVAMCRRHGVALVEDLDELAATLLLFDHRHRLAPGGLASIHDSGGEREMIVDIAERLGVPYAEIGAATREAIAPHLDPGLVAENPLDAWGTARDYVDRFAAGFGALVADPGVALGIFFSDVRENYWYSTGVAEATRRVARSAAKPVVIATNYSKSFNHQMARDLGAEGIPVLEGSRATLLAVRHAMAWRDHRPSVVPPLSAPAAAVRRWRARLETGAPIDEHDGLAMLAEFGLPVVTTRRAGSLAAAAEAATVVGYPVALKTAAGHAHKSDVGGVHLGLASAEAVAAAYEDLARRLGPEVVVAAMAPRGTEIGLGAVVDPGLGPLVVVSAGGVMIELLADRAAALAPFDAATAAALLAELRIHRLLRGLRGRPAADLDALARIVAGFSAMIAALSDVIAEIDVNPLIAGPHGAVAVDALVIPRQRSTP
ncbi:MAG: acetate--CoA ligase family protein [Alphaproteobacteria bacterium]|nr:acetate--CoA ligase family protein [Alphaproteobacteria bacterium]